MLKDFKEFAMKGNMVDMAVGIIIGAAFGKIVTSIVEDLLMPPLGLLIGKVDFQNLFVPLSTTGRYRTLAEAKAAGVATINYGIFLNNAINFLIVAIAVYLLISQINRLRRPKKAPDPTHRDCPFCCSSISVKAVRCPNCTSEVQPVSAN